ncbi:hypothetical protein J2808_004349 [Pseudarthrobacter sulfonivorans]|nr:hypothetical protein [Pseudarthrobacter sulfonivorans]
MSFTAKLADGSMIVESGPEWAYNVLDSGVLQMVNVGSPNGKHWYVSVEFSPNYWHAVDGTRFRGNSDALAGHEGLIRSGALVEAAPDAKPYEPASS